MAYVLFEGRPLTTKGQWFNPVVFGFFRLCRLVKFKQLVDDPVFIVGMGRSGTTALGSVLSMHVDVAYLNEPKALWHSIDDNEDLIGSYSKKTGNYRLSADNADMVKREGISSVYSSLLKLTGATKVVDKYPELIFRIPYVLALFPNAKFIILTRNGMDNCHSISEWCVKHRNTSKGMKHDWWGKNDRKWNALCDQILSEYDDLSIHRAVISNYESDFDRATVEWLVTMREVVDSMNRYAEHVIRVDYEDLCSDPKRELEKILTFANIGQFDEKFFSYGIQTLSRKTTYKTGKQVDSSIQDLFNHSMRLLGYRSDFL